MTSKQLRSLTGIRPSGNVHLGNYLGMIRPALLRQEGFECFYFLADMHALTTNKSAEQMRAWSLDLVATWLAFGFDTSRHVLYRQSDISIVTELAWYLSCCTGVGFLEKAHAYKDAAAQAREVNHGVFAYPVLMAADIILYDADVVPVGKDQKQHVEMARDMAGSFNAAFKGDILKLPEPKVEEEVMSVPGLDGRKMSKSYGNEIPLFADEKTLRKLFMSVKTDSTPLEAPKELDGTLVGDLFKLISSPERYADLKARLGRGGLGWGHAKEELFEAFRTYFEGPRARYAELRPDEKRLKDELEKGAERAYEVARSVINRAREAVGFAPTAFRLSR